MNDTDYSGKSLVQRMLDYRNRAEALRAISESTHDGPALLMLSIAASYDSAADTARSILLHTLPQINESRCVRRSAKRRHDIVPAMN